MASTAERILALEERLEGKNYVTVKQFFAFLGVFLGLNIGILEFFISSHESRPHKDAATIQQFETLDQKITMIYNHLINN